MPFVFLFRAVFTQCRCSGSCVKCGSKLTNQSARKLTNQRH